MKTKEGFWKKTSRERWKLEKIGRDGRMIVMKELG